MLEYHGTGIVNHQLDGAPQVLFFSALGMTIL